MQWRKGGVFNKQFWENCADLCERVKIEHSVTLYMKVIQIRLNT